jgi:hypothetical protein
VSCVERTPRGDKKPEGDGSMGPNGPDADFGIVSKMQARSVDPAAETDRKVSRRCRRVKGRIEKQASIRMDSGRAPECN